MGTLWIMLTLTRILYFIVGLFIAGLLSGFVPVLGIFFRKVVGISVVVVRFIFELGEKVAKGLVIKKKE